MYPYAERRWRLATPLFDGLPRIPYADLQPGMRVALRGEVGAAGCWVEEVTRVGRKGDGNWLVSVRRHDGSVLQWSTVRPGQTAALAPAGSALGWRELTSADVPAPVWPSVHTRRPGGGG